MQALLQISFKHILISTTSYTYTGTYTESIEYVI
jgi:hypothetical protein